MASSSNADNQALASILNAARQAVRREREENVMTATRAAFRPQPTALVQNNNSPRGRRRNNSFKRVIFVLRRSNADFYPSSSEITHLNQNGMGKSEGVLYRHWTISHLNRYVCSLYPRISQDLESIGFRYGKCSREKKVICLPLIDSITDLEEQLRRSILLVIPNQDLPIPTRPPTVSLPSTRSPTVSLPVNTVDNNDSDTDMSDFESRPTTPLVVTNRRIRRRQNNTQALDQVENNLQDVYERTVNNEPAINTVELEPWIGPQQSYSIQEESSVNTCSDNPENLNIYFPTLPEDAECITIEVKRENILVHLLELYQDETITQHRIKVVFKDEEGLDYGGLTKELFTEFWKKCQREFFKGENSLVPHLSLAKIRKGEASKFITIGRILAHTVVLTKTIPIIFCKTLYLKLGNLDSTIPEPILKEDFLNFLCYTEKVLLKKAESSLSTLSAVENDTLIDLFQTYGLLEIPNKNEISEQIIVIAENVLCKQNSDLIKKMKEGIPLYCEEFFSSLTPDNLRYLYFKQASTPSRIISCLLTTPEHLNNVQSSTYYFLKLYISNLNMDRLSKFLLFVTGSENTPDSITVSFKSFGTPVAHTCSNVLEMPTVYSTYQEMCRELDAILENEYSFQYSVL